MKLKPDEKFVLPDDDGNLILITDIEFIYEILQNRIIPMRGVKFTTDYENNVIKENKIVNLQTSFTIDSVYGDDE